MPTPRKPQPPLDAEYASLAWRLFAQHATRVRIDRATGGQRTFLRLADDQADDGYELVTWARRWHDHDPAGFTTAVVAATGRHPDREMLREMWPNLFNGGQR